MTPTIPLIQVYRDTDALSDDWVRSWIVSAQTALSRDFAPHYGDARLEWVGSGQAFTPGAWRFAWLDNADVPDALGDHLTEYGFPFAQVFTKPAIVDGSDPSVVGSHEKWEVLVDPFIDKTVSVGTNIYGLEVADACEDDRYSYNVLGHRMSDFVLPNYWVPGSAGPWTFRNSVTGPLAIAAGGYLPARLDGGAWTQIMADEAGPRQVKGPQSRTLRRFRAAAGT